jgi:GT2 family glycosyltransferase
MTPTLSILVVNWNTRELVLQCLDSLRAAVDDGLAYEVVVVDNGSLDGSPAALEARGDIHLVLNERNVGFAEGVNQAYRQSEGELILLLNSDVEFGAGGLSALVRFMRDRPEVAGVAPLYLNPDGSVQQFHFGKLTYGTALANASSLLARVPPFSNRLREYLVDSGPIREPQPVYQPSASCLLLRRAVLDPKRVFDERFPIYFNDVALARELAAKGHELWVDPSVSVVHEGHASTRLLGAKLRRHYIGSMVRTLSETDPSYRVWIYRVVVFVHGLFSYVLRRPAALPPRELVRALAGDVGPLPQAPVR